MKVDVLLIVSTLKLAGKVKEGGYLDELLNKPKERIWRSRLF